MFMLSEQKQKQSRERAHRRARAWAWRWARAAGAWRSVAGREARRSEAPACAQSTRSGAAAYTAPHRTRGATRAPRAPAVRLSHWTAAAWVATDRAARPSRPRRTPPLEPTRLLPAAPKTIYIMIAIHNCYWLRVYCIVAITVHVLVQRTMSITWQWACSWHGWGECEGRGSARGCAQRVADERWPMMGRTRALVGPGAQAAALRCRQQLLAWRSSLDAEPRTRNTAQTRTSSRPAARSCRRPAAPRDTCCSALCHIERRTGRSHLTQALACSCSCMFPLGLTRPTMQVPTNKVKINWQSSNWMFSLKLLLQTDGSRGEST